MKSTMLLIILMLFLSGCALYQLYQLAGRHTIRHPETGERLWAPCNITHQNWDAENKVWRNNDGTILEDIYLYPEKMK